MDTTKKTTPEPAPKTLNIPGLHPEAIEITNKMMEMLGTVPIEHALTAMSNLCGQIVAHQSDGKPSEVKHITNCIAEAIRTAAIAKLLHADNARRELSKLDELGEQMEKVRGGPKQN